MRARGTTLPRTVGPPQRSLSGAAVQVPHRATRGFTGLTARAAGAAAMTDATSIVRSPNTRSMRRRMSNSR
jgi:hypothetical protein